MQSQSSCFLCCERTFFNPIILEIWSYTLGQNFSLFIWFAPRLLASPKVHYNNSYIWRNGKKSASWMFIYLKPFFLFTMSYFSLHKLRLLNSVNFFSILVHYGSSLHYLFFKMFITSKWLFLFILPIFLQKW